MTEQQFDLRLKEIEKGYASKRDGVEAFRDQELSRLFEECGWTQERIARRMGKGQQWVSLRLIFGRFLNFTTTGCKDRPDLASLTERTFRRHWSKTKGDREADRFRQVLDLIAGCPAMPGNYGNLVKKPGYTAVVREILGDGKWHKAEAILADLEEKHPGIDRAKLSNVIGELQRPGKDRRAESRKKAGVWQYRLVESPPDPARAATAALYERCKPLVDELLMMSRIKQGGIAPGELAKIAVRMQRLFEAACTEDTVDVQR